MDSGWRRPRDFAENKLKLSLSCMGKENVRNSKKENDGFWKGGAGDFAENELKSSLRMWEKNVMISPGK